MEIIDKLQPFMLPGLIYGIGAIGLAITFRFLKFPDFTVLGSIMVGGIVCIYISNFSNTTLGLIAGFISGSILGLFTGFIISGLKIQSVLASIIVFTASYSIAYSLTDTGGGTISFNLEKYSIISSVFDLNDILLLLIVSLMICLVIAFIIRTKFGSLLLAMTASKNFLKYRHRYKNIILILTVGLGNGIVGLAGAFHALRDKSASVIGHSDFLPIILGALFGGNAITLWFTNKLHKNRIDDDELSKSTKSPSKLLRFIASVFSFQREDSKKIGMLFFTYVIGSFFLKEIHGIVHSKAFIDISFNLSHLIIALLIVFSVWWAGVEEE